MPATKIHCKIIHLLGCRSLLFSPIRVTACNQRNQQAPDTVLQQSCVHERCEHLLLELARVIKDGLQRWVAARGLEQQPANRSICLSEAAEQGIRVLHDEVLRQRALRQIFGQLLLRGCELLTVLLPQMLHSLHSDGGSKRFPGSSIRSPHCQEISSEAQSICNNPSISEMPVDYFAHSDHIRLKRTHVKEKNNIKQPSLGSQAV
mmetsp:Transcript_22972/g.42131  ORF Transcript_22972/g.42131 Transcript_22972/m.42131 type:complete len:205 (-) Transcript_22972:426-1040(-)